MGESQARNVSTEPQRRKERQEHQAIIVLKRKDTKEAENAKVFMNVTVIEPQREFAKLMTQRLGVS